MNENLHFHRRFGFQHHFEFGESGLPFQDHPGKTDLFRKLQSGGIMQAHLRGAVEREFRETAPRQPDHSDILHDQRIRT